MRKLERSFVKKFIILPTVCLAILASSANAMAQVDVEFEGAIPNSTIYGDITDDKTVDAADFYLLRSYILGNKYILKGTNLKAADVNLDGDVDSADYTLLRKYLMSIIPSLPYTSDSKSIAVPICKQEKEYWCWAATSQSLIKYWYKKDSYKFRDYFTTFPSQTQIVTKVLGSPINDPSTGKIEDTRQSLLKFGLNVYFKNDVYNPSLSFTEVKAEINAGRPFVAGVRNNENNNSRTGHAVIVCGYTEKSGKQYVTYVEPWYGNYETCEFKMFELAWQSFGSFSGSTFYKIYPAVDAIR